MKAAKIDIEPFWPELFAKCCESMDIKKFITNIGSTDGTTNSLGRGDPEAATNADSGKVALVEDDKKQESDSDDSGEDFFPDLFG